MPRFRSSNQRLLWLAFVVGLTAPLAFWTVSPWQPASWLARRLQAEMVEADADRIDFFARQLAAMDREGWSALLAAEQVRRPEVRRAARRAITELVETWRRLPPDLASPRVRQLAKLLAETETADIETLHFRADVAEALVAWPTDSRPSIDLVFDCEQLLKAAKKVGWPKPQRFEPAPEPPPVPTAVADGKPKSSSSRELSSEQQEPRGTVASQRDSARESDELIAAREPLDGDPATRGDRAEDVESPPFGPTPELLFVPSSRQAAELAGETAEQPAEVVASPLAPITPPNWPQLTISELIRHLRSESFAPGAEGECRRRGFNDLNLRVARAAADSDVENRVKLVRMLPELTGLDSIGWLLTLARDESPRVRGTAIQILSTANNPRIQRELSELSQTETDDGVRNVLRSARASPR